MFLWDTANTDHIARHGVTPAEAEEVIGNLPFRRAIYIRQDEERTNHLGETDAGRVLMVVSTERGEHTRVITAYPANRSQRGEYERLKEKRNDQNF